MGRGAFLVSEAEVATEAQRQIASLYRQLYAAEQLIEELERQRDQARSLAMAYLDEVPK